MNTDAIVIANKVDRLLESYEPEIIPDMTCSTCELYWACMDGDCLMQSGCCQQWREVLTEGI